jgi:hypothetical protein
MGNEENRGIKKRRDEELHSLYFSPNILGIIKEER